MMNQKLAGNETNRPRYDLDVRWRINRTYRLGGGNNSEKESI